MVCDQNCLVQCSDAPLLGMRLKPRKSSMGIPTLMMVQVTRTGSVFLPSQCFSTCVMLYLLPLMLLQILFLFHLLPP